jgi:hypothetical protein
LREGDGSAQSRVAEGIACEDDEVVAGRVGYAVVDSLRADGEFRSEDRREADGTGGFGESHYAVHAVVVG